ncbi:2-polyprenyl-6-methoxyphenol hydroxylase-like FAD-dependent oxidoreductase [Arthrobacter woluwensis]|uniref:flavin-dependent oxidoreductase n=1 Tax=Arthrobacter woluwensis TaxID=156980 RepID=UPI0027841F4C|nr:flavin-dependent oxidoreductase [Arthrobacter woluwensis]MDQ0708738.1 2-polyprenyl-6-methoxyphenol hydroxylase-like FAD-dependent oxidoreductase [Arthrobacter woluwensis]
MRIAIAGAGIGGLALALSLEAAGLRDVVLYERSREIRPLGVGINLLPHAVREQDELGLGSRIRQLGVEPEALSYFNRHGQQIWSEPRGLAAGYRWPQLSVHRGRLQLGLYEAVRERLGDVVRTGHRLSAVRDRADGVTATFTTATGPVDVDADVLIGADGIHSALRALRFPEDGEPVWSGLTLWRGTARIAPFLDGRTMIMAGDGEQKFVAYPLEPLDPASGTQRVNFIAERRVAGSPDADWNRAVDPAPIAELFRDWSFDWLDVPGTIAGAEEILEYPMVDRDALPCWTFGRTTLLADAAHAMYPNGSNGGSQAVLDARTLAHHLATATTIEDALQRYEEDRRPVTAKLLEMTRQTGPERVMQLAHERAPGGFADIHDVIPAEELEEIAASYKRVAGFHPDELNARASLSAGTGA